MQSSKNNLLFIVATISMIIDHIGAIFFPKLYILRIIGRIAFPIFTYGICQGVKFTSNIKKYILRILIAGIIAQPFYTYCFFPEPNIMFELSIYVLVIYFIKEEKYIYSAIIGIIFGFFNFGYGIYGVVIAVSFFYMDEFPKESIFIICILSIFLGIGMPYMMQAFAILSLPIIFYTPNIKINIPKYTFYVIYPLHLMILSIIKFL